jgi:hypothetical protein
MIVVTEGLGRLDGGLHVFLGVGEAAILQPFSISRRAASP